MRRRKDRVDTNQGSIVKELRKIPGVTVEVGHDDILIGYQGHTYWYEIKNPRKTLTTSGHWRKGAIKDDQRRLLSTFTGHYRVVCTTEEILEDIGICKK